MPPRRSLKPQITDLLRAGLSIREVAGQVGCSYQRVGQVSALLRAAGESLPCGKRGRQPLKVLPAPAMEVRPLTEMPTRAQRKGIYVDITAAVRAMDSASCLRVRMPAKPGHKDFLRTIRDKLRHQGTAITTRIEGEFVWIARK